MQRNLYINYQNKTRENQNQATHPYWAGVLQECVTENGCWSDTEAAPRDQSSWKEVLYCSQSLWVVKRRPLVRKGTSCSLKVQTRKRQCPRTWPARVCGAWTSLTSCLAGHWGLFGGEPWQHVWPACTRFLGSACPAPAVG